MLSKTCGQYSKEDVLRELRTIATSIGRFPTRTYLDTIREYKLTNAINMLKLCYHDLAVELGYCPAQKPRNFWTEGRITAELLEITECLGRPPSLEELEEAGRTDLTAAIFNTGTWRYYRQKIGHPLASQTWDKDKIVSRLKGHITNLGHVPTTCELLRVDRTLLSAIDRSAFTYRDLLIELGHRPSQRQKGFWKCWENVELLIRPFCVDGKMPSVASLKKELGSSVGLAVADFGGVTEVAERMGVVPSPESFLTAKDGHCLESGYEVEFDNFLYDQGIAHEVNGQIVPGRKCRYDFKIGELFVEIWGYNERPNNKRCVRYTTKRRDKEKLYRESGLRLLSIESAVFRKNSNTRRRHFREMLVGAGISVDAKTNHRLRVNRG